jgi:hypothetical protein
MYNEKRLNVIRHALLDAYFAADVRPRKMRKTIGRPIVSTSCGE